MAGENNKALYWMGVGVSVAAVGAALAFGSGHGDEQETRASSKSPRTVDKVDLNRYMGTWYEISRYPNPFEGDCAGDTMAHYSLQPDGRVEIVNSCRTRKGKTKTMRGTAKVVDPTSNAKLKIEYDWPYAGDYWVLILNSFYEYAVVGEPSRKFLWILSRTPALDKGTYHGVLQQLEELGYDASRLKMTHQSQRAQHAQNSEFAAQAGAGKPKAAAAAAG